MDILIGDHSLSLWLSFFGFVVAMLAVDLGVFNRQPHAVTFKEALNWSIVWVLLALCFGGGLYLYMSPEKGTEFITGYLIEKSLSVDNIFVFVLIFSYFQVPVIYKHRVLFWGIIGALVLRGIMIAAGAALLEEFHWIIYLFGAFLIFTGIKIATVDSDGVEPEKNPVIKLFRKFYPVTGDYHGTKFFTKIEGKRWATPLLLVIVMIGTTDFIFALDSIPAIFAITLDPFIVFTANVFAVLGLRSMYFMLAGIVHKFHYLKYGLSVILIYVGVKMVIIDFYKIPTGLSLGIVGLILGISIAASLVRDKQIERLNSLEKPKEL